MTTSSGYEVSEFTIHIPDEKLDDMYGAMVADHALTTALLAGRV